MISALAVHDRSQSISDLFPAADAQIVAALSDRRDALPRYLAQVHDLTLNEVCDMMEDVAPT